MRFRTESDTVCIFSLCEHTLNCELLAWRGRKRGEEVVIGLVVMLRHSNCHLVWHIKYPQKTTAAFIDSLPNGRRSFTVQCLQSSRPPNLCCCVSDLLLGCLFFPPHSSQTLVFCISMSVFTMWYLTHAVVRGSPHPGVPG